MRKVNPIVSSKINNIISAKPNKPSNLKSIGPWETLNFILQTFQKGIGIRKWLIKVTIWRLEN